MSDKIQPIDIRCLDDAISQYAAGQTYWALRDNGLIWDDGLEVE